MKIFEKYIGASLYDIIFYYNGKKYISSAEGVKSICQRLHRVTNAPSFYVCIMCDTFGGKSFKVLMFLVQCTSIPWTGLHSNNMNECLNQSMKKNYCKKSLLTIQLSSQESQSLFYLMHLCMDQ